MHPTRPPSAPAAAALIVAAALALSACSSTAPRADAPDLPSASTPQPTSSTAGTASAQTNPATPAPSATEADPTATVTVTATTTAEGASPASVLSAQRWDSFTYPRFHQSPIDLRGGEATVRDTYFQDAAMPARLHSVVSGEVSGSPATLVVLTVTDHGGEGWPDVLYLIYLFRAQGAGVESTASARAHDTTGASVRWTLGDGLIHQSVTHAGGDEWMGGPQATWLTDGVVGNRGPQLFPPLHTRPDPLSGNG